MGKEFMPVFVTNTNDANMALLAENRDVFQINQPDAGDLLAEFCEDGRKFIFAFDPTKDGRGEPTASGLAKTLRNAGLIAINAGRDLRGEYNTIAAAAAADPAHFTAKIGDAIGRCFELAEAAEQDAEAKKPPKAKGPEEILAAFLEEIQSRRFEPIETGIKDIDSALQGGFLRRTLVTLAAAPGMGKTALAQWVLENMAAAGHDVLYINLEMDRAQLLARSIARTAWRLNEKKAGRGFSALDVLRAYEWTPEQRAVFMQALDEYKERIAPHFVYNPDSLQGNHIDRILSTMKEEADRIKAAGRPAPIVCIDYLQIIGTDERETAEGIKQIIKLLKQYAIDNDTVVFLIIAQNRASNLAGVSEMESGRDTSAIEYSGDIMLGLVYAAIEDGLTWTGYERGEDGKIILDKKTGAPRTFTKPYDLGRIRELQREAYEAGTEPDPICNKIYLKVQKNRFGTQQRRATLIFDGEHSAFHQIEREARPDPEDQEKRNEWQQADFSDISAAF